MKKTPAIVASGVAMLAIALGAAPLPAHDLSWEKATGGAIPEGAIAFGNESSGEALFVCRAEHAGGVHLGKIRAAFRGCNIPFGGKEIAKQNYEVLVYR